MAQYEYPLLSDNYEFFNGLTRLYAWFGMPRPFILEPFNGMGVTGSVAQGGTVIIYTTRELSAPEKALLDSFMADPANLQYPTSSVGYTVFKVADLFKNWAILESVTGKKIKWIFWDWPTPGDLEIWVEGTLNTSGKNAIKSAYANSISEKV